MTTGEVIALIKAFGGSGGGGGSSNIVIEMTAEHDESGTMFTSTMTAEEMYQAYASGAVITLLFSKDWPIGDDPTDTYTSWWVDTITGMTKQTYQGQNGYYGITDSAQEPWEDIETGDAYPQFYMNNQ